VWLKHWQDGFAEMPKRLFPIYMRSLYYEEKGDLDWISMKLLKREKQ
jgi:hypothetical protein